MKRAILLAVAPLLALCLAAIISTTKPAPAPSTGEEPAQLTDDEYCKNWCCRRVCNDKNECYQHCWCCG